MFVVSEKIVRANHCGRTRSLALGSCVNLSLGIWILFLLTKDMEVPCVTSYPQFLPPLQGGERYGVWGNAAALCVLASNS